MDIFHKLLQFIFHNSHMAYSFIFLVSLSESLAVIGLLIPGTVVMFGIGAVVASGSIGLIPTMVAAITGAIVGDGISYWLGHHYHQGLKKMWPFNRYPQMLIKGEHFFHRHGSKSVLLGRFVGPVRPVIPVIAGMLGMNPPQFYVVNVLSAIGWAIAYIIPGVLFGTSLAVAGAVSTRLVVLILLVSIIIWGFIWLSRRLLIMIGHHGPLWFDSLHEWIDSNKPAGGLMKPVKRFFTFLFLHQKGEEILMAMLVLTFFFTGWGFLGVLQNVLSGDPLAMTDEAVYHFFQSLRTPWADHILVAVTELGDSPVNLCITGAILILLLNKRCYRTAAYWLFTIIGGSIGIQLLKWLLHLPRPVALYHGISAYGFPSGHTTMSAILYGFLAILIARRQSNVLRWRLFTGVFMISFAIAFSRIYLGAHWLSDVLGGFLMGTGWAALAGIAYLKGPAEAVPRRMLGFVALGVIAVAGVWHITQRYEKDIIFYAPRYTTASISFENWTENGWSELPACRIDLEGEPDQPLTVQWAGPPQDLAAYLISNGWRQPPPMNLASFLRMLSPDTPLSRLPILPRLHDGRFDCMHIVRQVGKQRWTLRLWPSDFVITGSNTPIFLGTIEIQDQHQMAGMIITARDTGNYDVPLDDLTQILSSEKRFALKSVCRTGNTVQGSLGSECLNWNGRTLLMWDRLSLGAGPQPASAQGAETQTR